MRFIPLSTSPDDFVCSNPDRGEHWYHDDQGNLIPGFIKTGVWANTKQ